MGDGNDYHGDAYMNAFQDVIASCPWLPVIGNHESTLGANSDRVDSSTEERYLNQSWGLVSPASTASSGLGHLLTKGTMLGPGSHGAAPSRTSQWASVDVGLIHFVIVDLDPGPPPVFSGAQAAWFEADLKKATANRKAVPWIVVTSHFPVYDATLMDEQVVGASAEWYSGEDGEFERHGGTNASWTELPSFRSCQGKKECVTVGDTLAYSKAAFLPLLEKYGVDIYIAGHIHSYSTTWPLCSGKVCNNRTSLVDAAGPVHVVEGNGGVPCAETATCPVNKVGGCSKAHYGKELFRMCGTGTAYGRLITSNSLVLTYEHVENPTSAVTDSWSLKRTKPRR